MLPDEFPLGPDEISRLMKAAGFNQGHLAERLGVTSAAVSKWVHGHCRPSSQHEATLRAVQPRPGYAKSWATFLAYVDATIAANRQLSSAAPAAPTGTADVPTVNPDAVAQPAAPKKARISVRRLARRLTEALNEQFDALRSKLDEASAAQERDTREIISEVHAARRADGPFEVAVAGLGDIGAQAEAAPAETEEALSALKAKVEAASLKTEAALGDIGAQVEAASTKTGGQLDELTAEVGNAGHTLQLVHAQQGRMDGRVRSLGQAVWGLTCVVALGFSALVLVAWRSAHLHLASALDGVVPGIHGEMGEPKTGKPVPDHPFPGQSRPPCFLGTTELSGGCWVKVADQVPPCTPGLYFRGNACYIVLYPMPKP